MVGVLRPLACEVSDRSALTASELQAIEDPVNAQKAHRERAGLLGCWSSHYAAVHAYSRAPDAAPWLLLLEDDVAISPKLFEQLPAFVAALPSGQPWHAVRLDTWGSLSLDDRSNSTSATANDSVTGTYAATVRAARWTTPRYMGRYYMGSHAVLVQRAAAELVAQHIRDTGATSPDLYAYSRRSGDTDLAFRPYVIITAEEREDRLAAPRSDTASDISHAA